MTDTMEETFRLAMEEYQRQEPKKLDPEIVLMRLEEALPRYLASNAGPRFKIGDVITPVSDSNVKGQREPYIVIDTRDAAYDFRPDPGAFQYGARMDVRVIRLADDRIIPLWLDSAEFELWHDTGTA